jgi:hypothetical protein
VHSAPEFRFVKRFDLAGGDFFVAAGGYGERFFG